MPGPDFYQATACGQISLEPVFEPVKADLQAVQQRILDWMEAEPLPIRQRLVRLTEQPGKMIRAAVLLLSAKACGEISKDHVELAAIVEMVHLATLLHDDVIDQASVRRGSASANALWGNTAAVLLGDLLLSKAFSFGVGLSRPEITALLTETAEEICRGELLQNLHRADWGLAEEQYMKIIDGKTAALFACTAALGAKVAGAKESTAEALTQYGRQIGQAFQIRDDLLDLLSTEQQSGKTLGTDLAECKLTLPLIVWLRQLPEKQKQAAIKNLSEGSQIPHIAEQICQSPAMQKVRKILREFCGQASRFLTDLPDSAAKEALSKLAEILSCPE